MLQFNKCNTKELIALLYNSSIHDAKIDSIIYEYGKEILKIEAINPIFNTKINLTFHDILIALAIKNNGFGSRETIISLTVEEDFSYLQEYLLKCDKNIDDSLYLLFQMFSGDELHIVSKKVIVEIA